ncbi:MAG: universal stress protein [Prevotella sp.]|nr:universal stress protein [Prevotella sp.]MCM1074680.1 universal stress protein [Ruminococcus sp.]
MEKYITLAIHTYDFASNLKLLLEKNGIPVQLENVNIDNPQPACGIRVRIPQNKLPKALQLVENSGHISPSAIEMEFNEVNNKLLVPIDFSDASFTTCRVAFDFAAALGLHPILMHVYATPYFDGALSNTDTFTLDIRDAEVRKNLESAAGYEMKSFCKKIDSLIAEGKLPSVPYSTNLSEGMPEEAILEFTRESPPELVVMSTHDSESKNRNVMGSVTAEVIDNCRVCVLTWPSNTPFNGISDLRRAIFFCNVNQNDLLAMDMFVRLMDSAPLHVTLVPVTDKAGSKLPGRMKSLLQYFRTNYPDCTFDTFVADITKLRESLSPWVAEHNVKLLVVPNKKKNIFARLFNPGIAHRVIFESDTPLLALPV